MDPADLARWRAADALFEQLLAMPEDAREAHLIAHTADDADLRTRVRRLLAAHATEDGLLDHPEALPLPPATPDAFAGRRLGRWQLGHEIGRGGMAVVYRAQSVEGPAGQDAALKILTLGTLAESGRERFLREQDALLRLSHPWIAALYDAGVAADGTPWLAMARVEGERIDAWCETHKLDVAARVRLLLQVCEAVAHAHRSLVIHRDIKPGNVLVDGDGHVRLLDFGIARLVDADDEQRTRTALRALTPEYAAPEQFEGAPAATTMDVYGIGALLYRLLTGVSSRTATGVTRTTGAITAPPPSRALRLRGDLGEADRRQRAHALRGDLDAIVMKALAPTPETRYASVDALGDDLGRWLDGLPVHAQSPSLRYRFGKFVSRHRLGVAASLLLLLVVAGGIAATLWQAERARTMAALAQSEQQRTERALARSEAISGFLFELFRSAAPNRPRNQLPSTAEVLAEAVRGVPTRFRDDPETAAEFLAAIASVYHVRAMEEEVALRRQILELRAPRRGQDPLAYAIARERLAYSLSGSDNAASQRLFDEAITELKQLAPGSRQLATAYSHRARLQMHLADGAARLRDATLAWDILKALPDATASERFLSASQVAAGHHSIGRYRQALDYYDESLRQAAKAYPEVELDVVIVRANRAGVLSHLGRFAEAEAGYRETLAVYLRIFDQPRGYMFANLHELEMIYLRQGRYADALRARDEWDALLRRETGDTTLEHAKSQVWRARILARAGRGDAAGALLDAGMPHMTRTGKRARNRMIGLLARIRIACDQPRAVQPPGLATALELAPAMVGDKRKYAAQAHALAGLCRLRGGDARAALLHLDRATTLDAALPPGDAAEVAEHLLWRGQALARLGAQADAHAAWEQARRKLQAPGFEQHPLQAVLRSTLGQAKSE